jgi:hypothetical protein
VWGRGWWWGEGARGNKRKKRKLPAVARSTRRAVLFLNKEKHFFLENKRSQKFLALRAPFKTWHGESDGVRF